MQLLTVCELYAKKVGVKNCKRKFSKVLNGPVKFVFSLFNNRIC